MRVVLLLTISVMLMSMCKQDNVAVKTNYHDLPGEYNQNIQDLLKTKDLSVLNGKSLKTIKKIMMNSVILGSNPHSNFLRSNYFWNIYNALPDFVNSNERHNGYYRDEDSYALESRLQAYSIYRIDRSAENIQKIYDYFKPMLPKIMSKGLYDSQLSQTVNGLLNTYDYLSQLPDFKQKLDTCYQIVDTTTGYWYDNGETRRFRIYENYAYGFSAYDMAELLSKQLGLDRYDPYYGSRDISFWMRRQHEGNIEVVHRILSEIRKMYRPKDVMSRFKLENGKIKQD